MTVAELSLWHDVPLVAEEGLYNFICEIPKCTRKKFEVATTEGATPIKQDEKKGVLREFKKGDIFFNYGCFPRTWEDPRHVSPDTGYPGDNDPLDVCEIGLRQVQTGEIRPVKVLGVLAMIDDDETDWKVVACVEINQCVGCTNSSLSHFTAMTRPCWHRHAIEQASRRWRGGRRDDSNAP